MATPNQYVQTPTFYLAGSGVVVGATSITLTGFSDILGNVLTMASFGTIGYGTLEPDTSNEEGFTFTSVTPNANGSFTLGGVKTVLPQSPYTQTSGLVRQHGGGQKVVITDNVAFWASFANKANDEIVTGTWTFNNQPIALSSTPASTTALGNVRLTSAPATTLGNPTITIASPAVITLAAHGLTLNDVVQFTTTGALPTGLSLATNYYVIAAGLATNTFEVSTTVGGAAVNTSGSQSGTHTLIRTTAYAVGNDDSRLPTTGQGQALAAGGNFGTPGSGNKYITQSYNSSATGIPNVQIFTSSGTYTKSANLKYAVIEVVGGGGGSAGLNGGGGVKSSSAGGGAGAYLKKVVQASLLGATETVTVGSGGTAGLGGPSVSAGGNGGTSTFTVTGGSTLQATGGGGGSSPDLNALSPGGAGGTATNGDVNISGGGGSAGYSNTSSISGIGTPGGSSVLGQGGAGAIGSGNNGGLYGGGASGVQSTGTPGGYVGAKGVVIITEYFS